uniref:Uncharacterized protein n=1 Tax=Solanum lycopersicum TaxID=4081 RepID=K4BT51_SOLLC
MQCMHGAMYIHICNVCHVLLIVLSLHFLHKNQLFLHLFITSSSSSNKSICLSIFMDYSPPLSSPDSTPPPSPPHYIEEPKTLNEQQLNEFREKAMHIIRTHTHEEATKIFLKVDKANKHGLVETLGFFYPSFDERKKFLLKSTWFFNKFFIL